jgi:hypothetical protein
LQLYLPRAIRIEAGHRRPIDRRSPVLYALSLRWRSGMHARMSAGCWRGSGASAISPGRPARLPVMSCPATAKWHQRVAHGIWIFPWPPGRETCGGSLPLVLIGARRSSSCSYGDMHASLRGCLVPRPYMATPQQAQLGTGRGRRFARHGKHCSVAGAPVAMARRAVTPTQQPLNISSFSTQSNKQLLGASAASSSIYGLLHDARDREG